MSMYSTTNRYYVYTYFDTRPEKNNEPIYVGKGTGKRSLFHLRSSHNQRLNAKIEKMKALGLQPLIDVLYFATEEEAFDTEKKMIKLWGRLDLKTGTLCNFTNGGEGHAGLLRSRETTAKATATTKATMATDEYKMQHSTRMKQAFSTDEYKAKRSVLSKSLRADPVVNDKIVEGFKSSMRAKRKLKYPDWSEEDHARHEEQLIQKNEKARLMRAVRANRSCQR